MRMANNPKYSPLLLLTRDLRLDMRTPVNAQIALNNSDYADVTVPRRPKAGYLHTYLQ